MLGGGAFSSDARTHRKKPHRSDAEATAVAEPLLCWPLPLLLRQRAFCPLNAPTWAGAWHVASNAATNAALLVIGEGRLR